MAPKKKTTKKKETAETSDGKITCDFTFRNATKNKYRYDEDDEGQGVAVGSLYVVKSFLGDDPPEKLTVTIEVA